jgi:1-acyl-sn-glycerol-3-phosphate acyltransferase
MSEPAKKTTPLGARSVLAGADRASGERTQRRRRPTPLLNGPTGDAPETAPAPKAVKKAAAKKAAAKKPAVKKPAVKKAAAKKAAVKRPTASGDTARVVLHAVPDAPEVRVNAAAPPPPLSVDEPLPAGGTHSVAVAIAGQIGEAVLEAVASRLRPAELEEKVAGALAFARRRLTGEFEIDEFGFDRELTETVLLTILRPIYRHWFRVDVRGVENIPAEGGALIVANHSGAVPVDALMTMVAVHEETPDHRFLRALGADLVFQLPFVSELARRSGTTLASNPDVERLLRTGHLVGVWPEGFKGIGKPFSERYKLQRFGRGGFVSAALRTGMPIIPCSIVGAEEIYPIIGNVPSLARLFGVPYVPITPFFPWLGPLGAIPLPSKWLIEFGAPVPTDEYGPGAAEDPMLVFDLTDQVRQSIQQTLYSLLVQRRSIFF